MNRHRLSAIGIPAGVLVAGLVATLPTTGAGADPAPLQHNWLTVTTGSVKQIAYYPQASLAVATPAPTKIQTISANSKCALGSSGDLLVGFAGKAGTTTKPASLAGGSIGVAEKNSGTSCSRVDAGEKLTLTLNKASGSPFAGAKVALSSALLEMDLKQDARILATARGLDGTTKKFELQSGSSIGLPPLQGVAAQDVFACRPGADSGADSGARDNCYWPISAPGQWFTTDPDTGQNTATDTLDGDGWFFDQLTLETQTGSFALQGGAESGTPGGANTTAAFLPQRSSFFEVADGYEGDITCPSDQTSGKVTFAREAGAAGAPDIEVARGENADADETCVPVRYSLETGVDPSGPFARFLKPLDEQLSAQFVVDLTWRFAAGPTPPPVPVTTIDFEAGGGDIDLPWCPDPTYAPTKAAFTTGTPAELLYSGDMLTGVTDPLAPNPAVVDMDSSLAGVQFACLATQYSQVESGPTPGAADDDLVVYEQVYLLGDARMRK